MPIVVQLIHQITVVTRQHNFALNPMKNLGKLPVLVIRHLVPVCLAVAARSVRIRGIAVEKYFRAVVTLDDF